MKIHIIREGHDQEIYSLDEVNELLRTGVLDGDELAWTAGLSDWAALSSISGVKLPTPPPPPGKVDIPPPILTEHRQPDDIESQKKDEQTVPPEPTGVGGCLLFFCVVLTILSPLVSIGVMSSNWETALPAIDTFPSLRNATVLENIITVVILVYGVIVGCMIWGGDPRGREIARSYLMVRLIGMALASLGGFIILSDFPSEAMQAYVGSVVGVVFREGVIFTIWWTYFIRSKRVANTYGEVGQARS